MADCLTDAQLAELTLGPPALPLQATAAAHLLSCTSCPPRLFQAYRRQAQVTETEATVSPSHDETAERVPPIDDLPTQHGRYVVQQRDGAPELLGRGGYGKVLLTRDVAVGRDVALKCLRSRALYSPRRAQVEARLLREARVVGQLEHPAIVPLYDVGRTAEGALFYTMRRIRGRTLAEAVAAAPDFAARLRLLPHVLSTCQAIAYAHSRGVIHRDLKPQNVMVDRFGQTAVIDWGLASTRDVEPSEDVDASSALRLMGSQDTLSDGKGRLGTPAYMSPEQLTGVRGLIDEKSDVWGLGALLFEVLTGRSPRGEGALQQKPPAVRTLEPDCPSDLAALCDKALAESRDARYPTAEALADDLDAWLHGREVKAHVYRPGELIRRFIAEHRIALAVGVVSLLALIGLSTASFVRVRNERNRAREFGLAMLTDVLPRVTSLGDPEFLARFTGRVQSWLDAVGADVDDPAVGRAWMRMAISAEVAGDALSRRFALRCLALAQATPAGVDRYGLEQSCGALLITTDPEMPFAQRGDAIEKLWRQPPPPGAEDDVFTLEARTNVAARLNLEANAMDQREREREASSQGLALARRWRALAPHDPLARMALDDALQDEVIARTNRNEPEGALQVAAEASREGRELLALMRNEQSLALLSRALMSEVSALRWFRPPSPEGAALEREAHRVFEALRVLDPASPTARDNLLQFLLETAQSEELPAVLEEIQFKGLPIDGQGTWGYAMVVAGRGAELLTHRDEMLSNPSGIDAPLSLALAAAASGDRAAAATLAREANRRPTSSTWSIDGMRRWAASRVGAEGALLRTFEHAFSAGLKTNDEPAMRRAMNDFAEALEKPSP